MINSYDGPASSGELLEVVAFLRDSIQNVVPCGDSVVSLLDRAFGSLTSDAPSDDTLLLSTSLLRLANEKLNSYSYRDVPLCWRRLYTDATLLKSTSRLLQHEQSADEILDIVKDLDLAVIIAGAPGLDRPHLVARLISIAQSRLPRNEDAAITERPTKRRRPNSDRPRSAPPYVARPVPVVDSLPDFLFPSSNATHTRPFVVRSAASDWAAVERWRDVEYLRELGGGPGRVVPVEVGNDYTKAGWGQRIVSWWTFLDSVFDTTRGADDDEREKESYYLAQHSLLNQFPHLGRDFPIPSLVYSEPPALENQYAEYRPPGNEEGWIVNAWLGGGGTVSQAHTDPYWNCYIQAVGSKWVWVAPPSVSPHMAAFGRSNERNGEQGERRQAGSDDGEETTATTSYMTNTSTIDVTQPLESPLEAPPIEGIQQHSTEYLERVEPFAQQVVLEAGDVLVMPPGWWHAMKSLETSFSISIWF
ncbi:hypothetical protein JCM11491_000030 [Sporobolomyces phaffii]